MQFWIWNGEYNSTIKIFWKSLVKNGWYRNSKNAYFLFRVRKSKEILSVVGVICYSLTQKNYVNFSQWVAFLQLIWFWPRIYDKNKKSKSSRCMLWMFYLFFFVYGFTLHTVQMRHWFVQYLLDLFVFIYSVKLT